MLGEGSRATTLFLPGMMGYDESAPHYTFDLAKCEEEFKASQWKGEDGTPLWDLGFRVSATYNTGNTMRQTISEVLQAGISQVNPKFVVEVIGLPWANFLSLQRASKLPLRTIGWLSDYFDPHNWASTFTSGYYGSQLNIPKDIRDEFTAINNECVLMSDPDDRDVCYKTKFTPKYHELASSILLFHVNGRSYQQRYINGWYANPMYSNKYYYALSKN